MNEQTLYTPAKVWKWEKENGGTFASTNRPIAGATFDKELPIGTHPLQLYSMGTPNGQKVTIMLEELLAMGVSGAEYDAWLIRIHEGDQFGSGFTDVNPNSKIPALMDHTTDTPTRIFESGSILLYLAEKFDALLPTDHGPRTECINWLFWLMGSAPYLGGGFGHFYNYAPFKMEYPIDRFAMEAKRQMDVLDRHLEDNRYLAGDDYSYCRYCNLALVWFTCFERLYKAAEFLDVTSYTHVVRWAKQIQQRPAVIRGKRVNLAWGPEQDQLKERHDASDFETKTQDKIGA